MGHVGEGESDLLGLDRLDLDPETRKEVEAARMLARDIINDLEPQHIEGYVSLIMKLEEALERVRREINLKDMLKNVS
jgi:anti-sigma factor ChrR (cupin superfamily)